MLPDAGTITPLRPSQVKFDWEEARRLHREGLSYREIAKRLGVSLGAVDRVCNPNSLRYSRECKRTADHLASQRQKLTRPCPCGRGVYWSTPSNRSKRCHLCAADAARTSVRETELECNMCREWKPDEQFPRNRAKAGRRCRGSECLSCDAARKREERRRARVVRSADGDRDTAPAAR